MASPNGHILRPLVATALGEHGVAVVSSADYLGRHQRGISLEHIRRDRILQEALATGADPLHLALVFNIDHTNAMAYANAARNLNDPGDQEAAPRRAPPRGRGRCASPSA